MSLEEWDIFICHSSKDKKEVARPLANLLTSKGMKVWLDESEIFVGDSLRTKIDAGLANSQFGIVILSPSFFARQWTKSELDGLISREMEGGKVVLPVWHNVSFEEVRKHSPILAGRVAAKTQDGLREVAEQVFRAIESVMVRRADAPIFRGRLTKKKIRELPEGSFLHSNCLNSDHTPVFAEDIGSKESREDLWNRISHKGLAGTTFSAYRDAGDYRRHLASQTRLLPVNRASQR
jgi:hypothetical protein